MSAELLRVSVAFGYADRQDVLTADVPEGATLADAVRQSGICEKYPEIDLAAMRLGVYGRLRAPEEPVRAGDRIEIYRPLKADPKQARRARAARKEGA